MSVDHPLLAAQRRDDGVDRQVGVIERGAAHRGAGGGDRQVSQHDRAGEERPQRPRDPQRRRVRARAPPPRPIESAATTSARHWRPLRPERAVSAASRCASAAGRRRGEVRVPAWARTIGAQPLLGEAIARPDGRAPAGRLGEEIAHRQRRAARRPPSGPARLSANGATPQAIAGSASTGRVDCGSPRDRTAAADGGRAHNNRLPRPAALRRATPDRQRRRCGAAAVAAQEQGPGAKPCAARKAISAAKSAPGRPPAQAGSLRSLFGKPSRSPGGTASPAPRPPLAFEIVLTLRNRAARAARQTTGAPLRRPGRGKTPASATVRVIDGIFYGDHPLHLRQL